MDSANYKLIYTIDMENILTATITSDTDAIAVHKGGDSYILIDLHSDGNKIGTVRVSITRDGLGNQINADMEFEDFVCVNGRARLDTTNTQ